MRSSPSGHTIAASCRIATARQLCHLYLFPPPKRYIFTPRRNVGGLSSDVRSSPFARCGPLFNGDFNVKIRVVSRVSIPYSERVTEGQAIRISDSARKAMGAEPSISIEIEITGDWAMHNTNYCNGLVRASAVMLLAFGADAYALDCAVGTDATGNDCTGAQATNSVSQADSRLPYLQGAAAMASLRLEQAKQRQGAAADAVKYAEADLRAARKALSEAEKAGRH